MAKEKERMEKHDRFDEEVNMTIHFTEKAKKRLAKLKKEEKQAKKSLTEVLADFEKKADEKLNRED